MKTYKVTLESHSGSCKKVRVLAANKFEAMAKAQRGNWIAVEAEEV